MAQPEQAGPSHPHPSFIGGLSIACRATHQVPVVIDSNFIRMQRNLQPWRWLGSVALAFMLLPRVAAATDLSALKGKFALPETEIDYADAKLAIDLMIDPLIDESQIRKELNSWTVAARAQMPAHGNDRQRLNALLKTLYEPGPWNQGRPFSYDLSDPLGHNPTNKQLVTYLATRKGNCVSMPILLVILGQRLDLPLTLATAPGHVLAKFADDTQQAWLNVEATAGGFKYDSSYEHELGISSTAIENGIYLRPLTPRENLGVMASTLMEHYARQQDANSLLQVTNFALEANPKDTVAMIWKANAYYLALQQRYVQKYPQASEIPAGEQADYLHLSQQNLAWFSKAEQLGWSHRTSEQESKYLESIKHEKARRKM